MPMEGRVDLLTEWGGVQDEVVRRAVEGRDDMVRVEDLQPVDELDVPRVDDAGAFLVDADGVRLRGGGLWRRWVGR